MVCTTTTTWLKPMITISGRKNRLTGMNRIVGFGASTMEGVGDTEGGFFTRLSRHPDIRLDFHNEGVGGNTLADMMSRVTQTTALQPYDIIVLLGCNDLPRENDATPERRSSLNSYTAKLLSLLPAIKGRRSLFVSSFPVSERATGISPVLFGDYMASAVHSAASLGYEVWNLYREPGISDFLAPDGLHFNDRGHAFIANRLLSWVRECARYPA